MSRRRLIAVAVTLAVAAAILIFGVPAKEDPGAEALSAPTVAVGAQMTQRVEVRPVPKVSQLVPPRPPASISGRVVSLDGSPASVEITLSGDDARTLKSVDGAFSFGGLSGGTYSVVAEASDGRGRVDGLIVAPGVDRRDVVIELRGPSRLEVHVVDDAGRDVERCAVQIETGASGACSRSGKVVLPVSQGRVLVRATSPGFATRELTLEVTRPRVRVELGLSRGVTISGRVVDAQRKPMPGVLVRSEHFTIGGAAQVEASASTGKEGEFTLSAVEPGRVAVLATAPGYEEARSADMVAFAGEARAGVELVLTPGGAIAGTVVRLGGEPVAGAKVSCARVGVDRVAASDRSIEDGSFRCDGLSAGEYVVVAEAGGARGLAPGVTVGNRDETGVSVILGDDAVEGDVLDEGGAAVAGALVTAWSQHAAGQGGASVGSDAGGHFRIDGLVGAPFRLEAKGIDGSSGEARGVMPGQRARIVVTATGGLDGWATDASGRGLADFTLTIVPADPNVVFGVASRYRVLRLLTEDGRFKVEGLPTGGYKARVASAGLVSESLGFQVVARRMASVTLALQGGHALSGKVLRDGKPAAGCAVAVDPPSAFPALDTPAFRTMSDAAGDFRFAALLPGRTFVHAKCGTTEGGYLGVMLDADKTVTLSVRSMPEHDGPDEFGGIGAVLNGQSGKIIIVSVAEGGPAFLAGVAAEDEVVAVDGWSTKGSDVRAVTQRVRGPVGQPVQLDLLRPATGAALHVVAERRKIATN